MVPLGFESTCRQLRPNPYLVVRREDLELHYFGVDGFVPENSYGSCLVVVEDSEPLYEAFSAGLRTAFGKLPMSGIPRITRPRRRKNAGNLSGFSLVDPGGNWIRVVRRGESAAAADAAAEHVGGKLATALANAEALAFLAELRIRVDDPAGAFEAVADVDAVRLTQDERVALAGTLAQVEELRAVLSDQPRQGPG